MPEVDRQTLAPLLGPSREDSGPSTPELKGIPAPGLTRSESYATGDMSNVENPTEPIRDDEENQEMKPQAGQHTKI